MGTAVGWEGQELLITYAEKKFGPKRERGEGREKSLRFHSLFFSAVFFANAKRKVFLFSSCLFFLSLSFSHLSSGEKRCVRSFVRSTAERGGCNSMESQEEEEEEEEGEEKSCSLFLPAEGGRREVCVQRERKRKWRNFHEN